MCFSMKLHIQKGKRLYKRENGRLSDDVEMSEQDEILWAMKHATEVNPNASHVSRLEEGENKFVLYSHCHAFSSHQECVRNNKDNPEKIATCLPMSDWSFTYRVLSSQDTDIHSVKLVEAELVVKFTLV